MSKINCNEIKDLQIPKEVSNWLKTIDFPEEIIVKLHYIFEVGAQKHGRGTWLNPDNTSLQPLANLSSLSRHNCQAHFCDPIDPESGQLHAWHGCMRFAMKAIRQERNIDI